MALGAYDIESPYDKAQSAMESSGASFGAMQRGSKTTTTGPGKTAGSAIMSAGSMAGTGFLMGGPPGAIIGGIVGLAGYLLS